MELNCHISLPKNEFLEAIKFVLISTFLIINSTKKFIDKHLKV